MMWHYRRMYGRTVGRSCVVGGGGGGGGGRISQYPRFFFEKRGDNNLPHTIYFKSSTLILRMPGYVSNEKWLNYLQTAGTLITIRFLWRPIWLRTMCHTLLGASGLKRVNPQINPCLAEPRYTLPLQTV